MKKYLIFIFAALIIIVAILVYFKKTSPNLNPQRASDVLGTSTQSAIPQPVYINLKCFDHSNYFVVTADEYNGDIGSDILIKKKMSFDQIFPCSYTVAKDDMQFAGMGSAEYFITILDHYLLTDSGTAPGLRGLTVYDLNTSKSVFNDSYIGPTSSTTMSYTYWADANIPATVENCPDYNKFTQEYGGSAKLITEVTLDLSTMIKSGLGKIECIYGG